MSPSESQKNWYPGSFTKNFTWGKPEDGLLQLYTSIRVGFDNKFEDVDRQTFIQRIERLNRPFHIPANFFLFNEIRGNQSFLVADELVFHALEFDHSKDFDRLALIAFLLSLAGAWKGARSFQRWPSLWAKYFVIEKLSDSQWSDIKFSADNIEEYLLLDRRYQAETSRKVATNLNYMFGNVDISSLDSKRVEQWWVSAVFLVLDRAIRDRKIDNISTSDGELEKVLSATKFSSISGPRSLEKELAIPHIIELYKACGREMRFDLETVDDLTSQIRDGEPYRPNSSVPIGAAHPSNFRIRTLIPRMCAMLAMYAGFVTFEVDETEDLDTKGFIQRKLEEALVKLKEYGIRPVMSVSELIKITRDR